MVYLIIGMRRWVLVEELVLVEKEHGLRRIEPGLDSHPDEIRAQYQEAPESEKARENRLRRGGHRGSDDSDRVLFTRRMRPPYARG